MRASYTPDGHLTLHLADVLSSLPPADKVGLIDTLACESEVIRHVTAQILDGSTEAGSYGARSYTPDAYPHPEMSALDWACRQVALRAGEVAAKEVERLQRSLAEAEKRVAALEAERATAWHEARRVHY